MNQINHNYKVLSVLLVNLSLVACSHTVPAPVIDISQSSQFRSKTILNSSPGVEFSEQIENRTFHVVKPGETLFSIAWRYDLDHKELADNNQIVASKIYPGQKLSLEQSQVPLSNQSIKSGLAIAKPYSSESLVAAINKDILNKEVPVKIVSGKTHARSQANIELVPGNLRQKVAAAMTTKNTTKSAVNTNRKTASHKSNTVLKAPKRASRPPKSTKVALSDHTNPVKQWIWPVNGKVVGRFSSLSNKNKGLDIEAKKGTPVRATAKGRVVYSGDGLRGYGQLVIIKHNDKFLSAYAHNDKIHVEENEVVKAGQRIAELGNTGSDKDKLHFEIRLKGKPVDPLNYLPKSGLM